MKKSAQIQFHTRPLAPKRASDPTHALLSLLLPSPHPPFPAAPPRLAVATSQWRMGGVDPSMRSLDS